MLALLGKYLAVFSGSMFKFILGPILGSLSKLSIVEIALLTAGGMMTSVLIVSLLGARLRKFIQRRFYKKRKLFSKKTRRQVIFWRRYGLKGVAFLTPILFSPIVGTLLATSYGESTKKIIVYMLISSIFWGFLLAVVFHEASNFKPINDLLYRYS